MLVGEGGRVEFGEEHRNDRVTGGDDADKTPQVLSSDVELGEEPFQVRAIALGGSLPTLSARVIEVARWRKPSGKEQEWPATAAAQLGRSVRHRVIVTNFEAALRVVRAGLAISLVPREVAEIYTQAYGLKAITLDEPWAERRFIICFRDAHALPPAAQLLVEHLAQDD